ncbi:MAG: 2-hydroxyglutaryl-CoA dehydratase [Spirochaetes bacterium]|jgi:predicted CoA-substrate-specific enzyme activase|nr:2-hydroxyglutaryl-CoA dehydratase [Spirochaetota bacterium]
MYAGIDIGSISAKMVISGEDGSILHSDYLYHRGEPAGTVGRLCRAARKAGFSRYRALCVTGSGRNYIGECLDADLVKNEITATWEAARVLLPEANTIIEIGGQDSKLISLDNGEISDFRLNSVCAAGTGAFIEQQSHRLGVTPLELSNLAMRAERPARFTGRCTVFVETEMINLQQRGWGVESIAAGLFEAVCENYLNDLGSGIGIAGPVLFCGGVSEMEAMRLAFARRLEMEVIVPSANRITAAYGAALIASRTGRALPERELPSEIAPPNRPLRTCVGGDCLTCGLCYAKRTSGLNGGPFPGSC